jgi:DNA-3-methyladenine glycosylase
MAKKTLLSSTFFNRPTLTVAHDLLGKYLVRRTNHQTIALVINEVEAYDGSDDMACHDRFGKTERTTPMFGPAGNFYVYLIYGMYWMLNIVTGPKNYPAAILIRGAGYLSGPGRLTKHLSIDDSLNSKKSHPISDLWIEDRGLIIKPSDIITTPRIGVDYAGPVWSQAPYRFILKNH